MEFRIAKYIRVDDAIAALRIVGDKMTDEGKVVMEQAIEILQDIAPADVVSSEAVNRLAEAIAAIQKNQSGAR